MRYPKDNYSLRSLERPFLDNLERKNFSKCSHTLCMLRFFVAFSFNLASKLGVLVSFQNRGRIITPKGILAVWLSLTFFYSFAWSTEVYTWVDGKKVTHFSQFPPTGQSASKIPLNYQPAKNATEAKVQIEALRKEAPDFSQTKGQSVPESAPASTTPNKQPVSRKTKDEKAEIHLRCEKAKQELAFLQSPSTPEITGNTGNTRLLTQMEKKQRLRAAQAQIEMYCD